MKFTKYRNKKVEYEGIKFDSIKERNRYIQLKDLEKDNKISNLKLQVKYLLIPRQTDEFGKFKYHPITYIADFEYKNNSTGEIITEDTKGVKTPEYKLKKKLFYHIYKKDIIEI